MSTPRFAALLGLALGAIWAFTGFGAMVWAGLLTAAGYALALAASQGRLKEIRFRLARLLDGQSRADEAASEAVRGAPATAHPRTRTTLR